MCDDNYKRMSTYPEGKHCLMITFATVLYHTRSSFSLKYTVTPNEMLHPIMDGFIPNIRRYVSGMPTYIV